MGKKGQHIHKAYLISPRTLDDRTINMMIIKITTHKQGK